MAAAAATAAGNRSCMLNGTRNGDSWRPKKILVFCDGTWCGDPTGTTTNIKLLADFCAGATCKSGVAVRNGDAVVCYFQGVGLKGTFTEYVVNGGLGADIRAACLEAYDIIVKYSSAWQPTREAAQAAAAADPAGPDAAPRVWLFGFSRGASTVRSVTGMIHNGGILYNTPAAPALADNLYDLYCNREPLYAPTGAKALSFHNMYSLPTHGKRLPPVQFLGLFDTVGALGVPGGVPGAEYMFYDRNVSAQVENVFQAVATHDNLAFYEPCAIRRGPETPLKGPPVPQPPGGKVKYPDADYNLEEVWFPGAHFDIGRARFVPFRLGGRGLARRLEAAAHVVANLTNVLGVNMTPTKKFSDNALRWMIVKVQQVDASILPKPAQYYVDKAAEGWRLPFVDMLRPAVTNDAYDKLLTGLRFFFFGIFGPDVPLLLLDRRISFDRPAVFYSKDVDNGAGAAEFEEKTIWGKPLYMSKTFHFYKTVQVVDKELLRFTNGQGPLDSCKETK